MIIRKPYDMSTSEKSRIRKLHESVNSLISEAGTPCSSWLSLLGPGNSGDVDCCEVLSDGPSGPNWHLAQPNRLCDKHWQALGQTSNSWQNCCPNPPPPVVNFACMGGVVGPGGSTTCMGPGNYTMGQANVQAIYPTMAACQASTCGMTKQPTNPVIQAKKKPKNDNPREVGGDMKRKADLEEIKYMNELYDITLGHEDKVLEEVTYELPKSFGNKRLTESRLIDMVNSIVKKY